MTQRALSVLLHSRSFHPRIGGLERVSQLLAEELTALGHRIIVVTDTPLGDATEVGSFRVVRGASSKEIRALIDACDLVHVNGFSVRLVRHCWWARKPLVWTHQGHQAICTEGNLLHGSVGCEGNMVRCFVLSLRHRGLSWTVRHSVELLIRRLLLSTASANVCVSEWVSRRIRAPRSRTIWNPVNVRQLAPARIKEDKGHFSYFGRLVPEKGPIVLLEALKVCRDAGAPFSARFIGDGPELEPLRARARLLGLERVTEFCGALVGVELRAVQERAWVTVIPTVCEEAMGLVAVEAMATGTPLIVSRRGALCEVAEACAITVANGSVVDLAAAMIELAQDEPRWDELAAAGPARAERFRSDVVAELYAGLYAEVAA